MYRLIYNIDDLYLGNGRKLYRPGEQDPQWLLRAAEHQRILAAIEADARAKRAHSAARVGIVARVRLALSRA